MDCLVWMNICKSEVSWSAAGVYPSRHQAKEGTRSWSCVFGVYPGNALL